MGLKMFAAGNQSAAQGVQLPTLCLDSGKISNFN